VLLLKGALRGRCYRAMCSTYMIYT